MASLTSATKDIQLVVYNYVLKSMLAVTSKVRKKKKKWQIFRIEIYYTSSKTRLAKSVFPLTPAKGVSRKFSRGGTTEKTRPKNSTIKPPSTFSVLRMKIQGGHGPPAPNTDAHNPSSNSYLESPLKFGLFSNYIIGHYTSKL